jgi:L-ascorbate peroxidase
VRKNLEGTEASGLSNADIIAMLGAYSVRICGGPDIPVYIGRSDAVEGDPEGRLPSETASIQEIKACFTRQGLTIEEFVCLCGAHTLGSKGFGDPDKFDNYYFNALLQKPWNSRDPMATMIGLPSDRLLPEDEECLPIIRRYAQDNAAFQRDFAHAYTKMVGLGYM